MSGQLLAFASLLGTGLCSRLGPSLSVVHSDQSTAMVGYGSIALCPIFLTLSGVAYHWYALCLTNKVHVWDGYAPLWQG